MFQVTPEKVLIATGAPKGQRPDREYNPTIFGFAPKTEATISATSSQQSSETAPAEEASAEEDIVEEEEAAEDLEAESAAIEDSDPAKGMKKQILDLRSRTKVLLTNPPKKLSGTLKQDLRALSKSLKSTLSRAATATASTLDDLEAEFSTLSSRVEATTSPASPAAVTQDAQSTVQHSGKRSKRDDTISNPRDDTKPYHTPWRPRDFMAAFAFIPRYLEVNQNICSAVYLRHPVCKPGLAEVPTPFHAETGQLAFNWYLRRR